MMIGFGCKPPCIGNVCLSPMMKCAIISFKCWLLDPLSRGKNDTKSTFPLEIGCAGVMILHKNNNKINNRRVHDKSCCNTPSPIRDAFNVLRLPTMATRTSLPRRVWSFPCPNKGTKIDSSMASTWMIRRPRKSCICAFAPPPQHIGQQRKNVSPRKKGTRLWTEILRAKVPTALDVNVAILFHHLIAIKLFSFEDRHAIPVFIILDYQARILTAS
mmetsp:Transcript_37753/g.78372  ORF Transcript_37753/g.78372 Transcript_37753/m.78372 type:complete len:216 (-) Transcript_37753:52-699(-)